MKKALLVEENLVGSYYNKENNTCDLQFDLDDKIVWIRKAPFMESREIEEDYWTDETIAYALENGGKIEAKNYVFVECRDRGGIGSKKYFDNAEEAIAYAKKEWDSLLDVDKKGYFNDPAPRFEVYEAEIISDEEEDLITQIWDALDFSIEHLEKEEMEF